MASVAAGSFSLLEVKYTYLGMYIVIHNLGRMYGVFMQYVEYG